MMNNPKVPPPHSGPVSSPKGAEGSVDPERTTPATKSTLAGVGKAGVAMESKPPPPPPSTKTTEGVIDQTKHAAQALYGQTKDHLGNELSNRKDDAVGRATDVADVIREAGEKLGGSEGGVLPDYANQAADQVERLTSYVRSRSIGQLIGDVEGFARREPLIFLGGSFALGLVAARFMKSSAHREPEPMNVRPAAKPMQAPKPLPPPRAYTPFTSPPPIPAHRNGVVSP